MFFRRASLSPALIVRGSDDQPSSLGTSSKVSDFISDEYHQRLQVFKAKLKEELQTHVSHL